MVHTFLSKFFHEFARQTRHTNYKCCAQTLIAGPELRRTRKDIHCSRTPVEWNHDSRSLQASLKQQVSQASMSQRCARSL